MDKGNIPRSWITGTATFGIATLIFGAAALAQTPSSPVGAAAQATGTAVASSTARATSQTTASATSTSVSGTAVATSQATPVPTIEVIGSLYQAGGTGNFPFADPAFQNVWNRTDLLVKQGKVSRTWFWGPGPNTPGLSEAYKEAPDGSGQRLVQYFDKSRMELNNPRANPNDPFFVTNGLLTVDLISGSVQVGNNTFEKYRDACIPMTGDFGDTLAPTYFAFQKVSVSSDRIDTHPATSQIGKHVTARIDRNGNVSDDPSKASLPETTIAYFDTTSKHNIPQVFWNFLNSKGPVYNANNQVVNEQLIQPWNYASGLPVSEAYWTRATIKGVVTDVLIQAYERRALTYVPTNPAGFQVEMANIGQHYFDWRYRNAGYCSGQPVTTPTPPAPRVTGTPQATGTAIAPAATSTSTVIPVATGTVVEATSTIVPASTATPTTGAAATETATPIR